LPLLFRARRALIIGDPHQLRHISTIRKGREIQLAKEHQAQGLLTDWSYSSRSIYDVAEAAILKKTEGPILLAEHYRSHHLIIEFSNRTFYGGELVFRTKIQDMDNKLKGSKLGVFWYDVKGIVPKTTRSAWNDLEITRAIKLLDKWRQSGFLSRSNSRSNLRFGFVTPFLFQELRMKKALRQKPWWNEVKERVLIGTAYKFQGDECDVMIFSPVVAKGLRKRLCKWVANTDQLLNVAITRARGALHVVGDIEACMDAGGYLAKFAKYVYQGGGKEPTSDLFESPAEQRMAELLEEVGLWFKPQYEVEEGRYRFDFLVVSPFGIRYDVEVDGREHWASDRILADEIRDEVVKSLGYRVIRVAARDVFNSEDKVKSLLMRLD
ncbi:DUF559 domain-containing protein, partial [candidate division WOR-3 bacterium]|nr:DUF559 domain-containing protein [candidate division WOR-3 bacterium]MBD3365218.1 DUF559 domain-containing protein [candidate division WOR-3 bacterium]